MDSRRSTHSLAPGKTFLLVLVAAWLIVPLGTARITLAANVEVLHFVWAVEGALLMFLPLLAGTWCGSARAPLLARMSIWGLSPLASCVVVAAVALGSTGTLLGIDFQNLRRTFAFTMTITSATWGYARLYLAFVARRKQLTLQGLLVAAVVAGVNLSVLNAAVRIAAVGAEFELMTALLVPSVVLILLNVIILSVSYHRRPEWEATGLFIGLLAATGALSIVSERILPPLVVVSMTLFVIVEYALLRIAIETRLLPWRRDSAPSLAEPLAAESPAS